MNRLHALLLSSLFVACAQPPSAAGTRRVTGQLSTASLTRLDNPAIVVRTAEGQRKVVHVTRTGEFAVDLPTGKSVHVAVATTAPSGGLQEVSTVAWPHRWSVVGAGQPIDVGVVRPKGASSSACKRERSRSDGGSDDDGDDEEDDDGGDDDHHGRCGTQSSSAQADLPYDAKLPLGATFKLTDAFLEKGPVPAKVLSVTMEGGSWRLAELKANTPFTVTQADCAHDGNRDQGRDRVTVSWQNADGSSESDHLDLRYCEGSAAPGAQSTPAASAAPRSCTTVDLCEVDDDDESECDDGPRDSVQLGLTGAATNRCAPVPVGIPVPVPPVPGPGAVGVACTVNADCGAGLACFQSKCEVRLN